MTAAREEFTALTTTCRAELASWSGRPPTAMTIGGGLTGPRPGCVRVVGPAGVGAEERAGDDGRRAVPLVLDGGCRRSVPDRVTVKPARGDDALVDVVGLEKGMASTTPGARSPSTGEPVPNAEPLGMKPSTATPVSVSEDTAATAAAGTPERMASEAVAEVRWWRALDVARRLMSSSRSGVHGTDRCHPIGLGTASWSARRVVRTAAVP
jgi:hypothetical protein